VELERAKFIAARDYQEVIEPPSRFYNDCVPVRHNSMSSNTARTLYEETVRLRGVPVRLDAVRAEGKAFLISGHFIRTAALKNEWQEDIEKPEQAIQELKGSPTKIDLLRFWQRTPESEPKYPYYHEWREVAAIPVSDYKHWFEKQITRSARNKVRKSAKFGVAIEQSELTDDLVRGIMGIFNQSPVRRGKRFWHYGKDFETVKKEMSFDLNESTFVTAYYKEELIGFIKLLFADRYALLTVILDKLNHRDKAPMNGMIAKAVELCATRKVPYLVYYFWRRAGHRDFQESTGFERMPIPEYFVPLTPKGTIALRLGLHRGVKGVIPERMMPWLLALRAKWYARKARTPLTTQ
jgi:hypothetical protein